MYNLIYKHDTHWKWALGEKWDKYQLKTDIVPTLACSNHKKFQVLYRTASGSEQTILLVFRVRIQSPAISTTYISETEAGAARDLWLPRIYIQILYRHLLASPLD